jgi:hypothetical protein
MMGSGGHFRRWFQVFATLIVIAGTSARATQPVVFTLAEPILRLPPASAGEATTVLRVDGLTSGEDMTAAEPLTVPIDLGLPPSPTSIKFSTRELQPGAASRQWAITGSVQNLDQNTSQQRFLYVRFRSAETTLIYTLTNKPLTPFSWSIKPPPSTVRIAPGELIPFSISVGPIPATDVKLAQGTLIEQSRKNPLGGGLLRLCAATESTCESKIELASNSLHLLYLKPMDADAGQFTGVVTVNTPEKLEGDSFNITVFMSSWFRQSIGIAVILGGVIIAWLISFYVRNKLNRDQLLIPVALLMRQLAESKIRLSNLRPEASAAAAAVLGRIEAIAKQLSLRNLENEQAIPPTYPMPWTTVTTINDGYKQQIQTAANWVAAIKAMIEDGICVIASYLQDATSDQAHETAASSIKAISSFADGAEPPPLQIVHDKISEEISRVTQLSGRSIENAKPILTKDDERYNFKSELNTFPASRFPARYESAEQINVQVRWLSFGVWAAFACFATLTGAYFCVFSNLGFGTINDYLLCLLWGVGLPIGGQQLMPITTSSVTSSFGISGIH